MATILIVEDNQSIREMLGLILGESYQILAAENGIDGLKLYKSYQPDLIISDHKMPEMCGLDFVKQVRSLSDVVKIIGYSSCYSIPQRGAEMLAAGADICLQPPFDFDELELVIARLLAINSLITDMLAKA